MPKELEKDFFTYILNHCDITSRLNKQGGLEVIRQGGELPKRNVDKTEEQLEMERHFKVMLDSISIRSMFKWFDRNNGEIDTGFSKINMMQAT